MPLPRLLRLPVHCGVILALLAPLRAAAAPAGPPPDLRAMLILNEDNSHFFGSRPAEQMNEAGLHAWVDQYAGTAVTHLFLNPNAMRASFRSRTRDAIWDPVDGREPEGLWPQNAKRLHAAGLDPYAIWIRRAREKGLTPWLTMRMNDVHSVDVADNFMHSTFWRTHPELRRVPGGAASPWVNHALNFAHAAVRAHQLDFVRELLERYDPAGLELDWMRFGHHLTPGRERAEGPLLTAFVREVRALTQEWAARRGHPIRLGVRVPTHPETAAGLGLDAVAWAQAGLVDLIVPAPFWSTSDFDIPVELWRERLGPAAAGVALAPGVEHNSRAWPTGTSVANDLPALRGFAAASRHRGAESLYLFNWMDSQTRPVSAEDYALLLRDGLSPAALARAPRRHPATYRDTVPPGFPSGAQLPLEGPGGGRVRLHLGPGGNGGPVWAIAGLAAREGVATAVLELKLNGQPLGTPEDVPDRSRLGGTARALRFRCPPEAVRPGYNELELRQRAGAPAQQVVWVEIRMDAP